MGNYASCALGGPGVGGGRHGNKSRGAKVLFPSGDIKHFYQPINAAELMFENPNHFLVGAQSLQIGRRFRALSADQDLEIGGVYVLFPMSRLNSVVSASDMGALFLTAKRAGSAAGKVKVAPEFGKVEEEMINNAAAQTAVIVPKLNLDDIEDLCIEEVKQRLSMSRSKRPTLDTIVEEPVSVRAR